MSKHNQEEHTLKKQKQKQNKNKKQKTNPCVPYLSNNIILLPSHLQS